MKIPSDVMWQLTKKYNSNIVKFNGESFSHNPLNLTNLHNRSSSGNLINIYLLKVLPMIKLLESKSMSRKILKIKRRSSREYSSFFKSTRITTDNKRRRRTPHLAWSTPEIISRKK